MKDNGYAVRSTIAHRTLGFGVVNDDPSLAPHTIGILKLNKWQDTDELMSLETMNGSYSIKKMLPAVVPEHSYNSLNVRDGWMASLLYAQFAQGQYLGDRVQLRSDLLAYCGFDTLAMVRILNALERA